MALDVKCGGCSAKYRLSEQLAGQYVECRKCHTPILVPGVAPVPAAATNQSLSPARATVVDRTPPAAATRPAAVDRSPSVAPAAKPQRPAPPPARDEADDIDDADILKMRDDDDDDAPSSATTDIEDEESFDLAPVEELPPSPPRRSAADRGSMAGRSVTAVAMDARASRSGQPIERAPASDDGDDLGDLSDLKEPEPSDNFDGPSFAIPVLPVVVTHNLLPWVLILGGLGLAGYMVGMELWTLPGHAVGFSLLGAALVLYAGLLVPLTLKWISSAADTAELDLPNVVGFQTFGLLALPTLGLVLGHYAGGTAPMITLGVLGLVAMSVLMAFMYRATAMQAAMTAFYGATAYVLSSALCVGILVGIGLALSHAGFVVPWGSEHAVVVKVDGNTNTVVAPTTEPVAAPVAVAPTVVAPPPPTVQDTAPAAVVPAGPPWRVPVEPVAAGAMWPPTQREVRESIEVATPIVTAHASDSAPFVALLEPKATAIYDLRTGHRSGFVKAAFRPQNLIISSDGALLAGIEAPQFQNGLFGADSSSGAIEIWSTTDGHTLGRVPGNASNAIPVPLGFAAGKLVAFGSSGGISGLQVWEPTNGTIIRQWSTPAVTAHSLAISHSGRYIAIADKSVVRVFDVQTGEVAGELASPVMLRRVKGMSFSPNGTMLAAFVPSAIKAPTTPSSVSPEPAADAAEEAAAGSAPSAAALQWNIADGGKLERSVPISLSATTAVFSPSAPGILPLESADIAFVQWTPDGRMLRVGDGLFDAASGNTMYTLPTTMSGNLVGRMLCVAGGRVVYEFMPSGTGTRLLLKTVDLPNSLLGSTVAMVMTAQPPLPVSTAPDPAPNLSPNPSPDPSRVAATPDAPSAAVVAPAPAPSATPAGAPAGTPPGAPALVSPTGTHPPAPPKPAGAIPKVTTQLSMQGNWDVHVKAVMASPDMTTVSGTLDNGIAVRITTESDAGVAVAATMHRGDYMHVRGKGEVGDNALLITLHSADAIAK